MRVMNKALKIAHFKSGLGLNISIKLNEIFIYSCMVFFAFLGRLKRVLAKLLLAGDR